MLTRLALCIIAVSLAASAGEYVVLSNGFRIHADSHASDGAVVRLQTSQGVIEIPATRVAAFEQEEYAPPAPAPPTPVQPIAEVQPKLTPQELITRAAVHAGLPPEIVHSVAKGNRVTVVGFGTFLPRKRKARAGRSPVNGKEIRIDAKTIPAFAAGQGFKEAVSKD